MNCKQKLKVKQRLEEEKRGATKDERNSWMKICDSIFIRSLIFHFTKRRKTGNSIFLLFASLSPSRSFYLFYFFSERARGEINLVLLACCHHHRVIFPPSLMDLSRAVWWKVSRCRNFNTKCDFVIYALIVWKEL